MLHELPVRRQLHHQRLPTAVAGTPAPLPSTLVGRIRRTLQSFNAVTRQLQVAPDGRLGRVRLAIAVEAEFLVKFYVILGRCHQPARRTSAN
jgi:hypothetical protein